MKIAFFVRSLAATQMSYQLIKNLNQFYETDRSATVDFAVFYESEARPCIEPEFLITNATDAFNYPGNLISTSLSTAYKANRFPKAKHSFYVYDLEWMAMPNKQYEVLSEIYQKPKSILTRSDDHANLIQKIWNCQARSAGDFDIKRIIELLKAKT